MPSVAENLREVQERITTAAKGRAVRLVAVSKTKPAELIREAYAAGQRDFGENYAQELAEKAEQLKDLTELRWHFIGHLQSNKAKLVAPVATMVHAVDSESLAKELSKRATRKLAVLVAVNVGGEASKHGVPSADVPALLDAVATYENLELKGLMTLPPPDIEATKRAFEMLVALRDANGGIGRLPELSMGMSDDLEIAIDAGSTMVRIGSAIFGARS